MGTITLTASDGFQFTGYEALPKGAAKGCVVVIQEVFGVNNHIREVCDRYANEGYLALAPAIFDRFQPGIELGYEQDDMIKGVGIARGELQTDDTLRDIQAAIDYLSSKGKVGLVGYCFGGLMSWMAAAKADGLSCVSSYYGGGIIQVMELKPKVPTIMHFGELDAHIPMEDVRAIDEAHADVPVYVYDADHGFNCDHRASYDEAAADLALRRTLGLFLEHVTI